MALPNNLSYYSLYLQLESIEITRNKSTIMLDLLIRYKKRKNCISIQPIFLTYEHANIYSTQHGAIFIQGQPFLQWEKSKEQSTNCSQNISLEPSMCMFKHLKKTSFGTNYEIKISLKK